MERRLRLVTEGERKTNGLDPEEWGDVAYLPWDEAWDAVTEALEAKWAALTVATA